MKLQPWIEYLDWSRSSPQEGDPECTCMLCGLVIGAPLDGHRDGHDDEYCTGCPQCEIAVRLFRGEGANCREQRYHPSCFEKVLAPNPKLGPVERSTSDARHSDRR